MTCNSTIQSKIQPTNEHEFRSFFKNKIHFWLSQLLNTWKWTAYHEKPNVQVEEGLKMKIGRKILSLWNYSYELQSSDPNFWSAWSGH